MEPTLKWLNPGFNLVIERLLFSTQSAEFAKQFSRAFQSRNRETSIFNVAMSETGKDRYKFQSRNRETSIFNFVNFGLNLKATDGFNLVIERLLFSTNTPGGLSVDEVKFQSRNRETSIFNRARHPP